MKIKGQAAMEFLMTYGWAILAAIVAIGALAYFGVFNSGNLITGNAIVNTPFYIQAWNIQSGLGTDGGINLELKNGGEDYKIYNLSVSNCGVADLSLHPNYNALGQNVPISANDLESFQILCGLNTNLIEGDTFKGDIMIGYRKVGSSLNLISRGVITERVLA